MSAIEAALLGLLQGLTEFLPVSSSGHLALGRALFGEREAAGPLFEVVVHLGTLGSILVVFRRDVQALLGALPGLFALPFAGRPPASSERMIGLIVLSAIPAGGLGLLLRDEIEGLLERPLVVGACLLVTGTWLWVAKLVPRRDGAVGLRIAVWMGLAQAVALLPGISRSGATIVAGLAAGGERAQVGRFAFLMAIVPIAGAGLLEALHVDRAALRIVPPLAIVTGGLVAFLSGWLALKVLLDFVGRGRLHPFAPYCWALGLLTVILSR